MSQRMLCPAVIKSYSRSAHVIMFLFKKLCELGRMGSYGEVGGGGVIRWRSRGEIPTVTQAILEHSEDRAFENRIPIQA